MIFFVFFIIIFLVQRLVEFLIDKTNEKWLLRKGAEELAPNHYKWFSWLHVLFLCCVIVEVIWQFNKGLFWVNWFFIAFYIASQFARAWCMHSLGNFWNTKVYIVQNVTLLKRGPYRILSHPEYIIVFVELLVIPIMYQAYISALVFPTLYIFVIMLRISELEKALEINIRYRM